MPSTEESSGFTRDPPSLPLLLSFSLTFPPAPLEVPFCLLSLLLLLEKPTDSKLLLCSQQYYSRPVSLNLIPQLLQLPLSTDPHPLIPHKSNSHKDLSHILLSFAYLDDESQRFALTYQAKSTFLILSFLALYRLASKHLSNLFLGLNSLVSSIQ